MSHPLKNTIKNYKVLLIFYVSSLIFVALFTWIISTSNITRYSLTDTNVKMPSIGEVFRIGDFNITIHDVRYDKNGNEFFKLSPKHHFVITDITLTNTSGKPAEFIPLLHLHARDSMNRVYSVEPIPTEFGQWSGSLLPHDTVRQEIGFEVPNTETKLRLYFETGTPNRDVAVVNLP